MKVFDILFVCFIALPVLIVLLFCMLVTAAVMASAECAEIYRARLEGSWP